MKDLKRKYLRLLALEIEDLREDIEALIRDTESRMARDEITRYVCLENLAILRNDILSVENVERILEQVHAEEYESLESLVSDLERRFSEGLAGRGFPEAPLLVIRRKLGKLAQFVRAGA